MALTDIAGYEAAFPDVDRIAAGDINMDGDLNFGDLQPFAGLLNGGPNSGSALQEPSSLLPLACIVAVGALRRRRCAI